MSKMSNEVIHKNASLIKTSCSGCLVIIFIIFLIGIYIYLTKKTDQKTTAGNDSVEEIKTVTAPATEISTNSPTEKSISTAPQKIESEKVNSIKIEAKPVKPVEDKTIIGPKIDNVF